MRTKVLYAGLLAGTALGTFAAPVRAQQNPEAPANAAPADETSGEIIVTARKRTERLQDVPVAVTAFTAETLDQQQVRNLDDLSLAAPNVYITKAQSSNINAQLYIRGTGQDDTFANVEPAIGLYVDGVAYTKAIGALLDVIEFDSIEVLRGPQGTLYGRNSTGGAIKFETRKPDLNEARFIADATVGSFNRIDVRASYSTPIAANLAMKLDVVSRNDDGYVDDARATPNSGRDVDLNKTVRQAAKLSFLYQPTDRFKLYASADYTRDRSGAQSGIPFISGALADNINASGQINRSAPLYGFRLASPDILGPNKFDGYGGQLTADYDFGAFALRSVLAYRGFSYDQGIDTNGGPSATGLVSQNGAAITRARGNNLVRNWSNDALTWENQLVSTGTGPFKFTVGTFYLHEKTKSDDFFGDFVTSASGFNVRQTTDSYALFGEISYTLFDRLELTAGGRYTKDDKDFFRAHFAAFGLPIFSGAPYSGGTKVSFDKFTPRFIGRFKFTDDLSVYASYSEGFQSGSFQSVPFASAASSNTPFAPTAVKSYEAGLRSQFFDRRLTANLTVFQADYIDIPSTVLTGAGGFTVLTNDVQVRGVEAEFTLRPADGLSLLLNVATLDDKYTRSVLGASQIPSANGANHVKFAPDVTGKFSVQYNAPLKTGATIGFGGNLSYSGDYYMNAVNTPFGFQKAYALLDANIGYEAPNKKWRLTLAGRNLTDKLYAPQASTGAGGAVFFAAPRTWSLTLLVRN